MPRVGSESVVRSLRNLHWRAVWLLCLLVLPAGAQEPAKLSLRQAIEGALAANPTLQALAAEARAAEARGERAAAVAKRPVEWNASLEANAAQAISPKVNYGYFILHNELSRLVGDGGKAKAAQGGAEAEARVAQAQLVALQNDLISEVTQAYWDWGKAIERVKIEQDAVELVAERLRLIRIRVERGDAPALDATRAEADLEAAQASLQGAQADVELRHAALRLSIGAWPEQEEQPADPLAAPEPSSEEREDLLNEAYEHSPVIAEALAREDLAAAGLRVASLARRPDYTLSAGYHLGNDFTDKAHLFVVSLQYHFTTSDHGAQAAGVREADALVERAKHEIDFAKLQTRTDLEQALTRVDSSAQRAATLAQAMEMAQVALDKLTRGYFARALPLRDVLDAWATLTEIRRAHLDAVHEYNLARADLARVVGRNLPWDEAN